MYALYVVRVYRIFVYLASFHRNSAFVLRRVRVAVEHDMHRCYTIPCTTLVQVMIFTGTLL